MRRSFGWTAVGRVAAALVLGMTTLWPVAAIAAKVPPVPLAKPSASASGDQPAETGRATMMNPNPVAPALPLPLGDGVLNLAARLTETGPVLDSGVVWRVFTETGRVQQPLQLVETATGGDARFKLPAGEYLVHAAYGQAGQSARIFVGGDIKSESIVLNAGGLRLAAAIAEDLPLNGDVVTFDIIRVDEEAGGAREVVASNVKPGQIYRLNAGTYQVTSRYGSVNAVVRAEITVQPGQLTDATIYHRAAEVTLKLVNDPGGEALANTSWSILTPGGDVVFEKVGAFPSVILAEGTYTIVAKHEIGMFSRQFSVEAGLARDVEVLTIEGR